MKNLLKKLFVIGLAIGVLTPFIEIPTVKADSCSNHLQSYLFLDVNGLGSGITNKDGDILTLFEYYKEGATNTTIFPYNFPLDKDINVYNVKFNQLTGSGNIASYVSLHNKLIAWSEDDDVYYGDNMIYNGTEIAGNTFTMKPKSDYSSSTILLHGAWSNYDEDFEPIPNNWGTLDANEFPGYVIQKELKNNMEAVIYNATVTTTGEVTELGNMNPGDDEMTEDYLNNIVNGDLDSFVSTGDLEWMNNQYYLPVTISRQLDSDYEDTLENKVFGYIYENTLFVFGKNGDGKTGMTCGTASDERCTVAKAKDVKNSYDYYTDFIHEETGEEEPDTSAYVVQVTTPGEGFNATSFKADSDAFGVDFNTGESYYWPFILSVEYETCSTPSSGTWTLEYDGNNEKALNTPDDEENIPFGDEVEVAEGPELEGYKFVEWCVDKDGKGDCYEPGDFLENEDNEDVVTLYAQWGKGGADEPDGDTGVFSYILSFIAVGAIAGTIYVISKKKNLFKQI